MKNIVFLASGNGGTIKFLIEAQKILSLPFKIIKIIADRKCGAFEFSQKNNLPCCIINYNRHNNADLIEQLKECQPDLIVTNIHKILDEEVLNLYPSKFINLHYSILPAYSGLIGMKTVDEAKLANAQFIGGTCHDVNKDVDSGKIICQGAFPVDWSKNIKDIYDKVFRISCLSFLNGILCKIGFTNEQESHIGDCYFNPKLKFNPQVFDEVFWRKLK